jgi:hypothetical protein
LVVKRGGRLIEDGVLVAFVFVAILAVLVLAGPIVESLLGGVLSFL